MRALQLDGGLGLANLKVVELPDPKPGPREVLIRVKACSLNYRDLLMIEGVYGPQTPLPMTPFSDGSGVVEAVGEGVTRFKVGDRVSTLFFQRWISGPPTPEALNSALGIPIPGAGREYAVFHEDGLSHVPEFLTDEQVSTLPCAALTAWRAMFEDARLQPGQTVLLQGTGGVSIFGLQFAKAAGLKAIITSSSDEKLARARQLGAAETINYKETEAWGRAARKATGGQGVDFVMEVGGGGTLRQSFEAIRLMGHIAIIGVLGGGSDPLEMGRMIGTGAKLQGVMVGSRVMFEAMCQAIELHRIEPVVDQVFPFTEAVAALEAMRAGKHFGKIVLTF